MENGTTDYQRLNRRCMASMYTGFAILLAFGAVFAVGVWFGAEEIEWVRLVDIVAFTLLAAYCIAAPPVFYRHYRYHIDGEKIDVIRGVIYIRRTFVPIERIMQVEVSRGPINRIWGLSEVTVTTAGGTATIEFLEPDVADRVAAELGEVVNRLLRARGQV